MALTDGERRHLRAVVDGTANVAPIPKYLRGRLRAEQLQAEHGSEDAALIERALRVSAASTEGGAA